MIIYSEKIVQFVHEIKRAVRAILSTEIKLPVGQSRFTDQTGRFSYPINIVVYNNKSLLGYFDPNFYEMGFHEKLMHAKQEELHNVIRHELGHYITFIEHGEGVQAHGLEFRLFCQKMGWGEEVYRASLCLETPQEMEENPILRKVKKLMALGSSSNQNESEQAMIKSQELLLKHNLEFVSDEEKVFLKRVLKEKRESSKMRTIGKILETFFVSVVYNRTRGFTYLEILGTETNVELAEYVAHLLYFELDRLWTGTHLKGTLAKNSFFLGIAKGYCNKVQTIKREHANAVLVIENQLAHAKALVYPHLFSSKSHARYCPKSSALGQQLGQKLTFNPAVKTSSTLELLQ